MLQRANITSLPQLWTFLEKQAVPYRSEEEIVAAMAKFKTTLPPQEVFIKFYHAVSALNPTHSEESVRQYVWSTMRSRFYQTTPLYADVYGYRFCPTAEQFSWLADRWFVLVKHPAQANMVASVTEDITASECSAPDTKKQIKKDGKKVLAGNFRTTNLRFPLR